MKSVTKEINLSLISHTNVGKTTLARTLLGKDIGEIDEGEHVTKESRAYPLSRKEVNTLFLWDTPGFGRSKWLLKQLEEKKDPVEWFINKVVDKEKSEVEWLNQLTFRHIKEQSDVILYLVDAGKSADEPNVKAEMKILSWFEKPVVVLLNQLAKDKSPDEESRVLAWKDLKRYDLVSEVLEFDAFFRCWVQEYHLWEAVENVISEEKRITFSGLKEKLLEQRNRAYRCSIDAMTEHLSNIVNLKENFEKGKLIDRMRLAVGDLLFPNASKVIRTGKSLLNKEKKTEQLKLILKSTLNKEDANLEDKNKKGRIVKIASNVFYGDTEEANVALAGRTTHEFDLLTERLVSLNSLERKSEAKEKIFDDFSEDVQKQIDPQAVAIMGGFIGGLITGFATDVMAGGLTGGAGTLVGAIIGMTGGNGLAKVHNIGKGLNCVSWDQKAIKKFFTDVILLYLSVAHFGRGRGQWEQNETPGNYRKLVERIVDNHNFKFAKLSKKLPSKQREELALYIGEVLKDAFRELHNVDIGESW